MSTKPQVLAWITCDSVYVDPATGKHTLLGIFSNLRAKEFPVVHPRMIWFLSFSDLTQGKHHLKISIGIPMSDEQPRTIIKRDFDSPGPQHRINLINDIHRLKFEEPGNYSILIEIDDQVVLASTFPFHMWRNMRLLKKYTFILNVVISAILSGEVKTENFTPVICNLEAGSNLIPKSQNLMIQCFFEKSARHYPIIFRGLNSSSLKRE